MIPGNDDALRAIRLFASKIADSVVEGSQAATDKQMADIASGVQYSEDCRSQPLPAPPKERDGCGCRAETDEAEEVSMEEVLGKGGRRAAAEIPARKQFESTSGSQPARR